MPLRRRAGRWLQRLRGRIAGPPAAEALADIPDDDRQIVEEVAPYTMTSPERRYALIEAVKYVVRGGIPGAMAECGVWRGGSVLAILRTLQRLGVSDRDVWLYDTFDGMSAPTERDQSRFSPPALKTWRAAEQGATKPWSQFFSDDFTLDNVKALLEATGYPPERLHFIRGPVAETLPRGAPDRLALLRLDTDWYESTRDELQHLYPRLGSGGVLIVDDYGHWQGCRAAVDEYFSAPGIRPILLNRIDYTGRIAVKP